MDHQTAVERRFPERYLLGELSPAEAADFETHFFDCPVCAEEIRLGAHLVANLKAVLGETVRHEMLAPATEVSIKLSPEDRFIDLTIALRPLETADRVSCEFRFDESSPPLVIAGSASDGSVRLRLPADRLRPGACTIVLRDTNSQRELGQRRLRIENHS